MKLSREQKAAQRKLQGFQLISDRMEAAVDMLAKADAARTSVSSAIGTFSIHGEGHDKMLQALVYLDEAVERILSLSERCTRHKRRLAIRSGGELGRNRRIQPL